MTTSCPDFQSFVDQLRFNEDGLIPAIAQETNTKEILMMAWMNKEAVLETLKNRRVCYFSRSRNALWRKGESSGQHQELIELRTDCDQDTLLLQVIQHGVACHTGRKSCFSWIPSPEGLESVEDVLIDPSELYKK